MKIIDILVKIANNEETPEYIKFYNRCNGQQETMLCCKENIIYKLDQLIIGLNDEILVLEEVEDKEYEDIEELPNYADCDDNTGLACGWSFAEEILKNKINALIRNQKKILEQLKKEGNNE